MRALRDFNMPKIIADDRMIFRNLLLDLFPDQEEPKEKLDQDLKKDVFEVAKNNKLIPEDGFCLKCVQLSEILEVRHCVFIIGPTGSGKSTVWKNLLKTYNRRGQDTCIDCLDPKAVTNDELFGTLDKSKEFKNGVVSSIIRNQSKEYGKYKSTQDHKWTILDGDIDPEWIESLNTVMDDNKVLTLVSNDRFPLTPSMRLIFEISNLRNATLATVTRAGVLYINDTDIGWRPNFDSWLASHREEEVEAAVEKDPTLRRAVFNEKAMSVFMKCSQYLDDQEMVRLKRICPVVEIEMLETTQVITDELMYRNLAKINALKKEED